MKTILTTKQVAKEVGVTIGTIYSYIYAGTLKAHKIGGYSKRRHWRIKVTDLEAFINDGRAVQNTLRQSSIALQDKVAVTAISIIYSTQEW